MVRPTKNNSNTIQANSKIQNKVYFSIYQKYTLHTNTVELQLIILLYCIVSNITNFYIRGENIPPRRQK